MHFPCPVRQDERRGIELGNDGRAGDAIAGAEGGPVEERHLAPFPRRNAPGDGRSSAAPEPLASIGRGGAGMRPVASTRRVTSSTGASSVKP